MCVYVFIYMCICVCVCVCSCLENPRDVRAGWAAISGVAQSRTRLKRLSSMYIYIHIYVYRITNMKNIKFTEF